MHGHFSPDQVVSGAITYRLQDFRRDLMRRVESRFPDLDGREVHGLFNLTYLLLYWLATDNPFEEFVGELECRLRPTPGIQSYLGFLRDSGDAEVGMLAAILRRMTIEGIEAGLDRDLAERLAFEEHAAIASMPQPAS